MSNHACVTMYNLWGWKVDTGVGTRGAGGLEPPKICERGAQPPEMSLLLVNTYLKVGLYILLAHALLY